MSNLIARLRKFLGHDTANGLVYRNNVVNNWKLYR